MKQQSRTVTRRRQSESPSVRHLPLVEILMDTEAELQELVVASGLKVLEAMLEEDRAAVCGPRYAHQAARRAYRAGHAPSQVVLGLGGHLKTGHRSTLQNRPPRTWRARRIEFYRRSSLDRKSACSLVRQLRGPHLSTCA